MTRAAIAAALILAVMPLEAGSVAIARHAALATPSPSATRVGLDILKRGGNAVDAAIAVMQALNTLSGGFLVYYDASTKSVWTLDFLESGTAAGIAAMHKRFGSIDLPKNVVETKVKPVWRAPIKVTFREYDIYTLPPPSSAGLMIAEELNILSAFDLKKADGVRRMHLLAEASRRAALDRDRFARDPAMARTTCRELVSAEHGDRLRSSIDSQKATPTVTLGDSAPQPVVAGAQAAHFNVIDADGDVAALTLTDDAATSARIFSNAAPAIVLRHGEPYLALGTSGGPAIPDLVLHTFLDVAVDGKSLADAVAAPRFDQQATPDGIAYESRKLPPDTIAQLRAMGHGFTEMSTLGDMQALMIEPQRVTAVADPRHGGAAGGY